MSGQGLLGELLGTPSPAPAEPEPAVPATTGGTTPAAIATPASGFLGMEGVRTDLLGMEAPILRLVHKIDDPEDKAKPGWYRLGSAVMERLEVVILQMANYRVLVEGEGKDSRNVCASEDLEQPHDGVLAPKSAYCESCAYSQWDDDLIKKKRIPPKCATGVAFMGVIPAAQNAPFVLGCKSTALLSAKEFAQSCRGTPGARGFFQFLVTLTSKRMQAPTGQIVWYAPVFAAKLMPPEDMEQYQAMAQAATGFKYRIAVRQQQDSHPVNTGSAPIPGGSGTVPPGGTLLDF